MLSLVTVLVMVLSMVPAITLPAAAVETFASPVSDIVTAQSGSVTCPACKSDIAWDAWTPINLATVGCTNALDAATAFAMETDKHYYLAEDLNVATTAKLPILKLVSNGTTCLHLNGKTLRSVIDQQDLEATGANTADNINVGDDAAGNAIHVSDGTLNLMGDGYVAGRDNNATYAPVFISGGANVNVYGGTYNSHRRDRACITFGNTGGDLTVYDGIFQDPFGVRGGATNPGNITIYGGTLTANYIFESSSSTTASNADCKLTITGGTFNLLSGGAFAESIITESVDPVVTGGTFNFDPSEYLTGCYAATEANSVWTVAESHNFVDGVCTRCNKSDVPAFELDAEGYAYCEACYKLALEGGSSREDALTAAWKQWEAYDGQWFGANTGEYYTGDHIHYYLDSDKTFDHTQHFMYTKGKTCLNLNGHTITPIDPETGKAPTAGNNAGGCTLTTTSRLYIMDSSKNKTGKVVGKIGDKVTDGAAIRLNWASARCYLFGGTFTRQQPAEAAACRPVLAAAANGGKFYMYDGVTVDGTGLSNTTGTTCVYLGGTAAEEELAQFNMYGGEIIGGEATDANGGAITVGPASTSYAEFNLYGGEIHGGTAVNGGNIYVKNGTVNMEGGKIYGGSTPTSGGNVYVDTNGVLNMSGGEMYGTAYDPNDATPAYDAKNAGNLYIYKGGVANLSGTAVVRDGSASSQAGNVYLSSTARLNMSGSAEIRDGVAASRGGNIRAYVSSSSANRPVITMAGNSKVYGGFAARLNSEGVLQSSNEHNIWIGNGDLIMKDNATIHGYIRQDGVIAAKSAIALTSGSRLVLDGNASIVNQTGTSDQIADVGATDTLIVTKDWKGTVYLNSCTVDAETSKITGPVASCGTFNYETLEATKDETATGTFTGKLYYYNNGNSPIMARNGDLYTAALGVVSGDDESFYTDVTDAMTDYASKENAILKAYANTTLAMTDDVRMDLNGKTVEVSGTGKLYAMDSGNDDYEGGGKLTVANTVDVVRDVVDSASGKRYINVTTAKGDGTQTISSYRVKMDLDTVTLRAGKTDERNGLYYKVKLSMGENLSNKVTTYGVVLSLKDMPRDNFLTEGNQNGFTAMEDAVGVSSENGYTVTLNSGAVFGIMKTSAPVLPAGYDTLADYNAARGKMPVYANAYLEIDADGDGIGEFYMAEVEGDDIAWSMHDVLQTIDGRWSDFAAAQQKLTEFYSFWHEYGMNQWTFNNIKKA